MDETKTVTLEAIDSEHDIRPVVVVTPDYNGDAVAHVFITGERVLRLDLGEHTYEVAPPQSTNERQALVALCFHIGELTEDQYLGLSDVWGTDDEVEAFEHVMNYPADEGRQLCAFVDVVEEAAYAQLGL